MKISKILTAFAVTCYAAAIGHDERGARYAIIGAQSINLF